MGAWEQIKRGYQTLRKSALDFDGYSGTLDDIPYSVGRVAADIRDDASRSTYWYYNNPLAVTSAIGKTAGKMADLSLQQSNLLAAGLSLGVMPVLSGNLDITNLGEFGRPDGYSALFPEYEDPTKTTNPVAELAGRYFLGRRGNLLPYDKFIKEKPGTTPENYARYKSETGWNSDSLFGLENNRTLSTGLGATAGALMSLRSRGIAPLARNVIGGAVLGSLLPEAASLGIVRGGWSGLDGQPYINSFGYNIPASALIGTALIAGGLAYGIPRIALKPTQLNLFDTNATNIKQSGKNIPAIALTSLDPRVPKSDVEKIINFFNYTKSEGEFAGKYMSKEVYDRFMDDNSGMPYSGYRALMKNRYNINIPESEERFMDILGRDRVVTMYDVEQSPNRVKPRRKR